MKRASVRDGVPKHGRIGRSVRHGVQGAICFEEALAQREGTVALYSDLIRKDKQKSIIRPDVDSTLLSLWLFSVPLEVIQSHLYGEDVSLEEVKGTLKSLVDMFKRGIYSEVETVFKVDGLTYRYQEHGRHAPRHLV